MKKILLTLGIAIASYSFSFAQWTGTTDIHNTNTGNVGIGTGSPDKKLEVFNYGAAQLRVHGWDDNSGNDSNNGSLIIGGTSYSSTIHYDASSPTLYFDNSWNNDNGDFRFRTKTAGSAINAVTIKGNGKVGIGTVSPDETLTVNGNIHSKEVKVDASIVPDYVFESDYKLTDLTDVKAYIDKNHHLPEIPAAAQIEKEGISLGDMNMKLLKKVEELTLYVIETKKDNDELKRKNEELMQVLQKINLVLTKNHIQ